MKIDQQIKGKIKHMEAYIIFNEHFFVVVKIRIDVCNKKKISIGYCCLICFFISKVKSKNKSILKKIKSVW
jgi:hypothetical protein